MRSLADRILVIYEGRIVGEFPPDASEEELGFAMTGGTGAAAADVTEPRRPARGRRRPTPAARPLAAYVRGGGWSSPSSRRCSRSSSAAWSCSITGHDPIATYKAIFEGTGFQWLFPWVRAPTGRPPR